MAEWVALECRQCGESETMLIDTFVQLVKGAENTRINSVDSGAFSLSLYVCDYCQDDE